jgi:hypothetical protein
MSPTMLNVIVCAPILIGWLAFCGPWHLSRRLARRRRRRDEAAWTRLERGLSDLDADLDRAWAQERERSKRRQP